MKFTEILEELRKGKKVTREKWEKCKTECYKYIKLEHGEIIAYLKDDNGEDKVEERTKCMFELADFTAEDWKIYHEKLTQVWKPNVGDKYYYISNTGSILYYMYDEDVTNKAIISIGNCFETKEEAQHMLQKIRIINQLQELSNIKFNENQKSKWCIFYDFDKNELTFMYNRYCKDSPFEVYFASKEDCQKAIDTIGEENLTKYYFDVED